MSEGFLVAIILWGVSVCLVLVELFKQRKLRKGVCRLIGKQNEAIESVRLTDATLRAKWDRYENRLWNAKNPYQTNTERVLCVCHSGLLRSPTCASTLHKEYGLNTRAVGLETSFALIPIDEVLLKWADTVIVMEYEQAESVDRLCEKYGINTPDIYNFSIPDDYEWGDSDLIDLIKQRWTHKEMYAWN